MSRRYSSISVQTTLATGVSNTALIIPLAVGTAAGLLGGVTLARGPSFRTAINGFRPAGLS